MNSNCQYLGWKDPFLDSAVDWIMENRQDSLDNLTIALPGKRALRGLEERIALATQACDGVPRLVSIGQLSDLLVETDIPRANDMTRLLAWVEALQSLDTKALQLLIAAPPASGDLPAWLNLAQILRTLHANIAAEMLDFGDVLKSGSLPSTEETLRWDLLQDLQIAYRSTLLSMGVSDPHDARAEKIREEQVSVEGEILLVGITDINKLQRSALELVQSQVTSLIFAPTEKSNLFDSLGCVQVDAWTDPELRIPIEEEDWSVANLPQEQSQLTVQALAKWNGEFSADEISIAVLDDEVRPYLERTFHSQGIATHHAEGTSIRQSSPWRLLDALASWLDGRLERNLAPLVRHSELCSAFSFPKTISELDAYHNKHLPHTFGSKILGKPERSRDLKAFIAKVDESLNLDSEQGSEARPVEDWIPCIQSFLETVWGEYELNEDIPRDFQTVSAIRVLSNGMESFLDTPQRLRKLLSLSLPATLRLLLQQVGGEFTSEKNPSSFVEMVGWLETRMDPAKAIVVCGFNEGKVPESKHADIFLPDLLLGNLGMPGNRDRYARDAYALTALFGGNRKIHLICGRQSTEGDRHRPSRLLFHCEPAQISKRLGRFLEVDGAPGGASGKSIQEDFEPPRRDALPELTSMRVTDFAAYLHSPYEYYLSRRLGLDTTDDKEREMDPLQYGILIHSVLEDFGKLEQLRDCTNPDQILKELNQILNRRVMITFGNDPLPAVRLQIEIARRRLAVFSKIQAERVLAGWRQVEVELSTPEGGIEVELAGKPIKLRAKMDRVDRHKESGKFQIIDFKTGESAKSNPYKKNASRWDDLQLPLYRLIAKKLGDYGEKPELAYWFLPRKEEDAGLREVQFPDQEPWDNAEAQAARIVTAIQTELDETGKWAFAAGRDAISNPILAGIAGQGLLDSDDDEGDSQGETHE